jgi:nucleoside-triphosphatase THEP1
MAGQMTHIDEQRIADKVSAEKSIYYRLIALWVLNEAMLGGVIHGLKIPVSGIVVGGCAIICICLIAWYVPQKGAIIKATIIVAIFKMMLSPQAPPPAYIAVFFQGLMGELLFWNRRFFKLSCILLAVTGLLESGFQRILMLTIIYGKDLWMVINDFINGLTKQKTTTNYSLLIGGGYVVLHFIAGIIAGSLAAILPHRIEKWSKVQENRIILTDHTGIVLPSPSKRKKGLRAGMFVVWIILILLYVQSYFAIGTPLLPAHISLKILLRSVIIILAWVFIVGPLLKRLLHYWLQKKKTQSQQDIQQVLQLLPSTKQLIAESWTTTRGKKGWRRLKACTKKILVNALNPLPPARLFILTGPVQTGKTTSLIKRTEKRNDVSGIVTPVVDGKRMFMNIQARQLFDMEAASGETGVLIVGRFIFSKKGFDKAKQIISNSIGKEGWLVIDEIGPLELRGEGFSEVLREVLAAQNEKQKILLVVREGLTDKVKEYFRLKDVVVINNIAAIR